MDPISIDDGGTTALITNLSAGEYSVDVTDQNSAQFLFYKH